MFKLISTIIVLIIFLIPYQVDSSTEFSEGFKDESIFSVLNMDGDIDDIYVINSFYGLNKDYGEYEKIQNLSGMELIDYSDGIIKLPNYNEQFYYEGLLSNNKLPWDFNIEYLLDGDDISPLDLAGATGNMTINIYIQKGDPDLEYFFNNFALQTTITLPKKNAKNIKAEGATMVDVGGNKEISFTTMPGREEKLSVNADINDFNMEPISINGIRMILNMDDNIDIEEFTNSLSELESAILKIDQGALELLEGINDLKQGFSNYNNAMFQFKEGMSEIKSAGNDLKYGFNSINDGLNEIQAQNKSIKNGIESMEDNIFKELNKEINAMNLELPTLDKNNYKEVLSQDPSLEPILLQTKANLEFITGLNYYIDSVDQISESMNEFSLGFSEYIDNIANLSDVSNQLYISSQEINKGLNSLKQGMYEYRTGTESLSKEVRGLDRMVENEINNILSDFQGGTEDLISFTSNENKNISSVQFFFRTSPIEKEEVIDKTLVEENNYSFWQRLLMLFGWSFD